MHLDPALPSVVAAVLVILFTGLVLRRLRQPHVVGYLLVGVLLGPFVLGLIQDPHMLSRVGAIGVVLLLFFVGMEISPRGLASNWRVAILGTGVQILLSVGLVMILGLARDWPMARILLLGFVISLSSTAVVMKMLQDWSELDTRGGQDVLSILIVQDLAIVPMVIVVAFLGGSKAHAGNPYLMIVGGIGLLSFLIWTLRKGGLRLPFDRFLSDDHEMQVFAALALSLGMALITGLLGLSTALGAFAGGLIIASARSTHWIQNALEPFRIVAMALFFVSIGMLVELSFLRDHWWQVGLLTAAVLVTNTFINAGILRVLGRSWRESLYSGALLAQVGEFSFVLAAVGLEAAIITEVGYQYTVAVISVSLLVSPAWISLFRKATGVLPAAHASG